MSFQFVQKLRSSLVVQNWRNIYIHPTTTSDFDRDYVQNGSRYPKSENTYRDRFLSRSSKTVWWSLVHYKKWDVWVWTHSNRLFRVTIFRPLWSF